MSNDIAIFITPARAAEVGTRIAKNALRSPESWTFIIKPVVKRGEMKGYSLTIKHGSDSFPITNEGVANHG